MPLESKVEVSERSITLFLWTADIALWVPLAIVLFKHLKTGKHTEKIKIMSLETKGRHDSL